MLWSDSRRQSPLSNKVRCKHFFIFKTSIVCQVLEKLGPCHQDLASRRRREAWKFLIIQSTPLESTSPKSIFS